MKITKIGHCCLVIEENGVTIMTDPGAFSTGQEKAAGIDAILITHEHGDHLHTESVRQVLENNPSAIIFTNAGVGKKLDEVGIRYTLLEGREKTTVKDLPLEAFDCKHEEIYEEMGQVQNTGYVIGDRLFYPGDSFFDPGRKVDVLALPVAGPWCTIADAVRYALRLKPNIAFPVHDGMLQKDRLGSAHGIPAKILPEHGITFVALTDGTSAEF